MAEKVFVFGAGASVHAGAPLMYNFIERAEDTLNKNNITWHKGEQEAIKNVLEAREQLSNVNTKTNIDVNNLEALFGLFEMGRHLNKPPKLSGNKNKNLDLSHDMKILIYKTIDSTVKYDIEGMEQPPRPSNVYHKFFSAFSKEELTNSTFISLNYDVLADYALEALGYGLNYCLRKAEENSSLEPKLLKLHGSLNWFYPSNNKNEIQSISAKRIFQNTHAKHPSAKEVTVDFTNHCKGTTEIPGEQIAPVIIPPSWNKTEHSHNLQEVWRTAAKELESAKAIHFIGYSMPETDAFFKHLLALGTLSSTQLRKIIIFNPDDSKDVKNRFESMFGSLLTNNSRFQYIKAKFDDHFLSDENKSQIKNTSMV